MQIFQSRFRISILTLFVFLSCDQMDLKKGEKNDIEPTLSFQNLTRFTYVAIKHTGPYEDFNYVKEEFLREIQKQQIISTGSPFLIYYNNPENTSPQELEWEIGLPTPEGTMVKEPLILKTWMYERVARVEKEAATPITSNIYPMIFEQVSEKNLTYQGPTAIRILNNMLDDSSQIFRTEIWIPLAATNAATHIAE